MIRSQSTQFIKYSATLHEKLLICRRSRIVFFGTDVVQISKILFAILTSGLGDRQSRFYGSAYVGYGPKAAVASIAISDG
jgi:hypothetical protein